MIYNNYMYAVDRSDEYLAHYGIKGMKWGVQKAIENKDADAYNKHYRKAMKRLAKLERQASSGSKYAKRAALLTGAAGITGGVAVQGATGIARSLQNRANRRAAALRNAGKIAEAEIGLNADMKRVGRINAWGSEAPFAEKDARIANSIRRNANENVYGTHRAVDVVKTSPGVDNPMIVREIQQTTPGKYSSLSDAGKADYIARENARADAIEARGKRLTNNRMLKAGTAAATIGLLGAAGYNAYRAATTDRAARKAEEWRQEIDKTFGTSYSKKKRK